MFKQVEKVTGFVRKILFGNENYIQNRIYIANLCSSFMYSVQSALLLLVVTRVGGLYQAGVFSIIYTVTQTLASLGSYSMRSFQVSDVKNEYSFGNYYSSRLITCLLMLLSCFGYAIFKRLSLYQIVIVMLFSIYRTIDGIEDVYHGFVQKEGRLDVASFAMLIRIALSVISFSIVYIFSNNLLIASAALALTAVLTFLYLNYIIKQEYQKLRPSFEFFKVIPLLWTCFPIFAGAILYNYLVNVPKYSIDRVLTQEMQTIFNIIFMPIFVINVLGSIVFKPMIVYMSIWWKEKKFRKIVYAIIKQCFVILGLTVSVVICGYLFGSQILGLVYGVDLAQYRILFTILLLLGGIAALGTFFSVILTIIRRQSFIIWGYILSFVYSAFFMDKIVKAKGIYGAGIGYGIVMSISTIFFAICIMISLWLEFIRGKRDRSIIRGNNKESVEHD